MGLGVDGEGAEEGFEFEGEGFIFAVGDGEGLLGEVVEVEADLDGVLAAGQLLEGVGGCLVAVLAVEDDGGATGDRGDAEAAVVRVEDDRQLLVFAGGDVQGAGLGIVEWLFDFEAIGALGHAFLEGAGSLLAAVDEDLGFGVGGDSEVGKLGAEVEG